MAFPGAIKEKWSMTNPLAGTQLFAFLVFVLFSETGLPVFDFRKFPLCLVLFCLATVLPRFVVQIDTALTDWRRPPLLYFLVFLGFSLGALLFSRQSFVALAYLAVYGAILVFAFVLAKNHGWQRIVDVFQLGLGLNIVFSLLLHVTGLFPGYDQEYHRFSGLYRNPNPMGAACGLFILLYLSRHATGRISILSGKMIKGSPFAKGLELIFFSTSLLLLWTSQSRSAQIALMATIAICGVLMKIRGGQFAPSPVSKRIAAGVLILCACFLAYVVLYRIEEYFLRNFVARLNLWNFLAGKILREPLFGYGIGVSRGVLEGFGQPWALVGSHNAFIDAALYSGIPGGVLFLLFIVSLVRRTLARYAAVPAADVEKPALCLYYVILSLVEPVITGWPHTSLLVVLMLSCYAAEETGPEEETQDAPLPPLRITD